MNKKRKYIIYFEDREVKLYTESIAIALTEITGGEMLEIIN